MRKLLSHGVTLEPKKHIYTDVDGRELKSVSKMLGSVDNKFDAKMISRQIALRGICAELGRELGEGDYDAVDEKQREILQGWEDKKNEASDFGTMVHEVIDRYLKSGEKEVGFEMMLDRMQLEIFGTYKKGYAEEILYSKEYDVAGTSDYLGYIGKGIVDIWDWKTNLSKGIEYCSKRGKYFKAPMNHLSDCNYNKYSLQLSSYGKILNDEWGYKIRKMNLVFIPAECPQDYWLIPVPFMKSDAIILFDYYKNNRESEIFEPDPKLETL